MRIVRNLAVMFLLTTGLAMADSMILTRADLHNQSVPVQRFEFASTSKALQPAESLATYIAKDPLRLVMEADPSMSAMVRSFDHESDGGIGMVFVLDDAYRTNGPEETAVPEPLSILLVGSGLTGIAALKRKRLYVVA